MSIVMGSRYPSLTKSCRTEAQQQAVKKASSMDEVNWQIPTQMFAKAPISVHLI